MVGGGGGGARGWGEGVGQAWAMSSPRPRAWAWQITALSLDCAYSSAWRCAEGRACGSRGRMRFQEGVGTGTATGRPMEKARNTPVAHLGLWVMDLPKRAIPLISRVLQRPPPILCTVVCTCPPPHPPPLPSPKHAVGPLPKETATAHEFNKEQKRAGRHSPNNVHLGKRYSSLTGCRPVIGCQLEPTEPRFRVE